MNSKHDCEKKNSNDTSKLILKNEITNCDGKYLGDQIQKLIQKCKQYTWVA
jgi:hypothetical protein